MDDGDAYRLDASAPPPARRADAGGRPRKPWWQAPRGLWWRRQEAALLGCLLLYAGVLWIWGVGRLDIAHSMEAARAVGAQTMMRTGDYLIPRIGERINLAKPPLFYWAVTLTSRLGSGKVTEATVRLASALSAMSVLLVLYFAVRPVFGPVTAYVGCLIAATLPMAFGAATVGEVNMMLALAVTCSLFAAFYMMEQPRSSWVYAGLCGAGLAAGLMTKGPVVLLFFVPTALLYVGYARGDRLATDWRWSFAYMAVIAVLLRLSLWAATQAGPAGGLLYGVPVGMLLYFGLRGARAGHAGPRWLVVLVVALLLAAPWPVLAAQRLGYEELRDVLVREMWQSRSSNVGASNRAPIWYYAGALPVAALPCSFLVPLAFFPGYGREASSRQGRMLRLARCWLAGSIVLFSVVSPARRVRYLLPAFPAISLLAADVFVRGTAQKLRPWMNRYVRSWAALCVYALCLGPFLVAALWLGVGLPWSGWATGMTAVAGSGAVLGLYLLRVRRSRWAPLVALALVLVGAKILMDFGYSEISNRRESPRLACERIRAHVPPGERLYLYGKPPAAAVFYLDAEPSGLREALDSAGHALVCAEPGERDFVELQPGVHTTELDRVRCSGRELVLFRLDRAVPGGGED